MIGAYWPSAGNVNDCIKNEAESADISVLLAVHQPSPLLKRTAGSGIETPATEQDLLEAFLTKDVPSGALVVPITGASGVGKSHVIRWLHAQLQRSERSKKLHIIRIPKSASLRTVVETILAPLAKDPRYAKAREGLTRAVAAVDLDGAVVTFRAHLENALTAEAQRMRVEAREDQSKAYLRPLIGHAEQLPKLFSDAAFSKHFIEHVLLRVVGRALRGRKDDAPEDETASLFRDEDLILPNSIDTNLAAREVKQYYVGVLSNANREERARVILLLNSVVDIAVANVFQLEQSASGLSLQDIILAVRELLFEDDLDLVLLVEDFAALTGIQQTLLNVCIQEGVYEGRKVRATMRTAIALTDGYLSFKDTILTRAQREWVISGRQLSDQEIKSNVVNLVGGYLDAARWGAGELKRQFSVASVGLPRWPPVWRGEADDESVEETLQAFGVDDEGRALFPFNRQAIEAFATRYLSGSEGLVFNPRRVINEILRATLLMRGVFEANAFPPAEFGGLAPNTFVASWLRDHAASDAVRARLGALLMYWGAAPVDADELSRTPPGVFKAFGLPTPFDLGKVVYQPSVAVGAESASPPGAPLAPAPAADREHLAFQAKLDEWSNGRKLAQEDARVIRNVLTGMLEDAINWPALHMRREPIKATSIVIPNAQGHNPGEIKLAISDDHLDPSGVVRSAILAALRFERHGRIWTYPGADDDYVASRVLVERLLAQLLPYLELRRRRQLATLGRVLVTQSRIGGLTPPLRLTDPKIIASMYDELPPAPETPEEQWQKLRASALEAGIEGEAARTALQKEIIRRIGSFQGAGATAYAIDPVRLIDALGDAEGAKSASDFDGDLGGFIRQFGDNRIWAQVSPVVTKLRDFRDEASSFLSEGFDKQTLVEDLQEIVRMLTMTGNWPTDTTIKFTDYSVKIAEFQSAPIVALLKQANRIVEEADREQVAKLLNDLGVVDLGLAQRTTAFLRTTNEVMVIAERALKRMEALGGQADPTLLAGQLTAMIAAIEQASQGASGESHE